MDCQDLVDRVLRRAGDVGVFDAQHELAAVVAGIGPGIQRGAGGAQVQETGGAEGAMRVRTVVVMEVMFGSVAKATLEVVGDVVHVLQAHGQAHHPLANAGGLALGLGQPAVRGGWQGG